MMLLCIVDIYFYHLWMNSLGWSFFGNFKSCLRGEESFEKNYSTVKKKQKPRWTCDISMAAFLMVKKKRKKKKESRIGQKNWKRQMIRKIHLQFQISELSIYSRYRRISSNSWPRSEKHRFVSAYPGIDRGGNWWSLPAANFRFQLYRYHCDSTSLPAQFSILLLVPKIPSPFFNLN